ncbi:hypothetical protein [Brevibacillus borstelensis]|uniref:hypothetical protein n=1 Tax=Brevibacillus borstelensis TaxID=45462 RepID=UPI0004F29F66|nr:hypothetical protein [Brevibacillus borstelensis]KKX52485.1 hypothetical protein X546_25075 [Brevibacillus borstelensis cifa_chp40]
MKKIKVTPTEDHRHYIHPDTKQEFPSGVVVETEVDWFVKAKLNMGHLVEVKEKQENDESSAQPVQNEQPAEVQTEAPLSLEDFEKLSAADQIKKLIDLGLAADEKDEAISNKEKRVALYNGFLNGADA